MDEKKLSIRLKKAQVLSNCEKQVDLKRKEAEEKMAEEKMEKEIKEKEEEIKKLRAKKDEFEKKQKLIEVEEKKKREQIAEEQAEAKRTETEKKIKHRTLFFSIILSLIPTVLYSAHCGLAPAFETPKALVIVIVLIGFVFPPAFLIFSIPALLLLFLICYGLIPVLIGVGTFLVLYLPVSAIVKKLTE